MNPTAIHDHIAAFQAAIQDAGLGRPDISANDILNRFSCLKCEAEGKRRNRNAWYRYFNGRTPGGAFGCWRCGAIGTWCSKKSLAGKERDEFQSHMESVKLERDKALAETHRRARERAAWVWEHAKEANSHPYLGAKGVQSHGLRVYKDLLAIVDEFIEALAIFEQHASVLLGEIRKKREKANVEKG